MKIKRFFVVLIAAAMMLCSAVPTAFADDIRKPSGDYTARVDYANNSNDLYNSHFYINDGGKEYVAYCFNKSKLINHTVTNHFGKIPNATNAEMEKYAGTGKTNSALRDNVLKVVYNGYPNNAAGIQGKYGLTDNQFRGVTQAAVWYFTDGTSLKDALRSMVVKNCADQFYSRWHIDTNFGGTIVGDSIREDIQNAYNDLIQGKGANPPAGYQLDIYINKNSNGQNLLSTHGSDSVTPTDVTINFQAKKSVSNGDLKDKAFTFKLTAVDNAPMPESATAQNDASGNVKFGDITFNKTGTYKYTISEVKGENAAYEYDTATYNVTVTVTENNGTLSAKAVYTDASGNQVNEPTFTNSVKKKDIKVNKEWADGASGEEAKVVLVKNGKDTDKTLTLTSQNGWHDTFEDLDVYDENGNEIKYTVREIADNYDVNITYNDDGSVTVSNSPSKDKTSLTVNKSWADGVSGESAVITLVKDGSEIDKTITLDDSNNWTGKFSDLEKYGADGHLIKYTVVEKTNNYTVTYQKNEDGSITVTNGPNTDKTSVKVRKDWADGASGESATVVLVRNGEETIQTLTLNEGNNWTGTFENLPKKDNNGNDYTYTVKEIESNYDVTYSTDGDTLVVTNKPSTEKTKVYVDKKWAEGASGESAVIELYSNGQPTGNTTTLNEGNNWEGVFEDLDKYDKAGKEIKYTVVENTTNYNVTISGPVKTEDGIKYTVTNAPKTSQETTRVSVRKIWEGKTGEKATVQLLANGSVKDTVELNESNQWSHTFDNLPKKDSDGKDIVYTVSEIAQPGYTTSITGSAENGFTITNTWNTTPVTDRTSVNVQKKWAGRTGEKAVIHLFADGTEIQSVELNESNDWHHTFSNLPKYNASGVQIVYTITEDEQEGFVSSIIGSAESGFIVTNTENTTIRGNKTKVHVEKKWVGTEGSYATVHLLANGQVVQTVELTEDNNWEYEFSELPTVDEETGDPIVYTVSEDQQQGYTTTIKGSAAEGFVITNAKSGTRGDNGRVVNGGSNGGTKVRNNGGEKPAIRPAYGPKTGDSSDIALYLFLIAGAAAAAAVVHHSRKRDA